MSHAVRDVAAWDPASSIPTLIGSLTSLLATALVILLWTFAGGKKRRDFRYALVLNLTVAGTHFTYPRLSASHLPELTMTQRIPQLSQQLCIWHRRRHKTQSIATRHRMRSQRLGRSILGTGKPSSIADASSCRCTSHASHLLTLL